MPLLHFIIVTAVLTAVSLKFPGFLKLLGWAFLFPLTVLGTGTFVWVGITVTTGLFTGLEGWFWCSTIAGLPFGLMMTKEVVG
jgi:hypothetical protein